MSIRGIFLLAIVCLFGKIQCGNSKLSEYRKQLAARLLAASQIDGDVVTNVLNQHPTDGLCCKFQNATGYQVVYAKPNGGTGQLYNVEGQTEVIFVSNQICDPTPTAVFTGICFVANGALVSQILGTIGQNGATDCHFYN
jgi:hypothetical protein